MQPASFRQSLREHLESPLVHTIVVFLILVDMVILMAEHVLLIIEHNKGCQVKQDGHSLDLINDIFHYTTVLIVSVFVIEMLLKFIAFNWRYFMDPLIALDVIVITSAAVSELILPALMREIGALFIVVRVVRLMRFAHAFADTTRDQLKKQLHAVSSKLEMKEEEVKRLRSYFIV